MDSEVNRLRLVEVMPVPRGKVALSFYLPTADMTLHAVHGMIVERARKKLPKVPKGKVLPVLIAYTPGKYDVTKDRTFITATVQYGAAEPAPT